MGTGRGGGSLITSFQRAVARAFFGRGLAALHERNDSCGGFEFTPSRTQS
jgi:hypothetical protein